ncbi:MAG TPA: RHS repeat-associated core domain-containing protein, partial [Fibrobacteraceae bacterium]|nr:RHS repeat-associated core domain-containing protein [Fibrobacteraceae bacterium]
IYGKPTEEVLNSYGVNFDSQLFSIILSEMKNIRDKNVGATVAYDASGNATVVKMASYDRLGRKEKQWVVFMTQGMPAIQLSYEYNQSDELTHSRFEEWDGSTFVAKAERYRSYDSKGRLIKIEDENHQNIAAYEYTPNGNVKRKSYYDKGTLVYDKVIIRDVQGRPTEMRYEKNGVVLYTDKLEYETPLAGRLSEAERSWNIEAKENEKRTGKYSYDDDGRLTKVEAPLSGEYQYKGQNGQLSYKKEGDSVIAMSYSYDKYRPAGFNINNRSPTATAEYFKYDDAGNVWYDRHAKTSYKLNAAGLPEVAYIQNEYHADLTLSDVNSGSVNDIETTMYMNYDESGQRIWTRIKKEGRDYAEFTLSGVGVYLADIGAQTGYSLTRMDLVAGGYRDGINGKAYFPVTDAQGNVRGYANDEGLVSAYDYYAYGGVEDIVVNETDDKKRWAFIRETFTPLKCRSIIEKDLLRRSGCEAAFLLLSNRDSAQGKEFDGEHGKYYFGARYFDPFFGMWMSPDPAAQFANPYTYGGDPLNYVDPNGEWVHIVVGAVIGAAVGTVNGVIQCTSAGGGSCTKSIGVGFVGGAAVGALAAGTGGVATGIAGVGFQSAAAGAVVGGAVGGGVGSAGGYASNYLQQKAMGYDPKWDKGDFWKGIGIGAGIGGAMGGLLYGLSDNYALGVDKTVAEWGDRMNMLDRATKAIGYGGDYDVDIAGWYSAWDAKNNSNYNPLTDGVTT